VSRSSEEVARANPMHKGFVERALAGLTSEELVRFELFLGFCERGGASVEHIAGCYLTVVEDTLGEQMYFLRHKKYRHSNYPEVADFVYHNREYMNRYMYGLVVTAFLWPNHVHMARFFREKLPRDKGGAYLEIGPGHGYYMMTAVSENALDRFAGVDISEASIAQTRAMLDFFAPQASGRIELRHCDFLDATTLVPASFNAIVMGEVLEHVEQPGAFLRRIAELSRSDAFIYVTTCINAPAVGHIYPRCSRLSRKRPSHRLDCDAYTKGSAG
jgi:2-polyprenyl-3-methyl-5-hydroxy-6-metoxy-1,4-benzoquinol methylase